jgi:hypothetical protein
MIPPGAAMVVNPHGTKRCTPAALAAVASRDWSLLLKLSTALMMMENDWRRAGSTVVEESMVRMGKPRSTKALVEGLEID